MSQNPPATVLPFEGCSDGIEPNPRHPLEPVPYPEFKSGHPLTWIVKKFIPRAELIVIYGEPGCGKTFTALALVMAIARGIEWHGYRVKKGRVVYVCAEGRQGFMNRLKAYQMHHNLTDDDFSNFQIIPSAPNFLDDKDPIKIAQLIGKADVIVIDTFSRVIAGSNENLGEDVGPVLARCQRLTEATGAVIIFIHHSGKDSSKGARGWSGMKGAADTEIEIIRDGNNHKVRLAKQKDGEDGIELGFNLFPLVIGQDEDNEDITSCYYEVCELSQIQKEKPLGKWQQRVMNAFEDLYVPTSRIYPTKAKIVETVKSKYANDDDKRDVRTQRIIESINSLVDTKVLSINGEFIVRS